MFARKKAPLLSSNRKSKFKSPSILEFQPRFATEKDCARFLFEKRWPNGWVCPRCGATKCYPIRGRKLFECANCRYQISVTAGTVLHGTRTPLRLWFLAIFFMMTDKRGISSVWLGKQLGISQKQAWIMLHKLRKAMAVRNGLYKLDGLVELDESFFGAPKEGGCRGRSTAKKKVLVGLSLKDGGKPLHISLRVVPRIDRAHLEPAIEEMAALGATIKTDGLRSYLTLSRKGYQHERIITKESDILEELRWLHVAVSNAKALIGGTHHGLGRSDGKHLQAYLDEFAYRFNRRYRPDTIFDRCLVAVAACPVWTYRDIIDTKLVDKKVKLRAA
jgi:transposase-like protein